LLLASASGQQEISLFFLEKGADPNATDARGFTALHYTALRRNNLELLKALLAHGANPNARVVKGYPPFNVPSFGRSTGNSMPHLKQPGTTPFFLAAASQDPTLMRLLATSGADPKLATQEGTTPLMVAVGLGRVEDLTPEEEKRALESVQLAIELGADVNAANQDGQTALHAAAYLGANSIVQCLVEKGAKLNLADKYGQTPLDIALGDPRHLVEADKRFAVGRREHKPAADLLVKLGAAPLPAAVPRVSQATGPGIPQ